MSINSRSLCCGLPFMHHSSHACSVSLTFLFYSAPLLCISNFNSASLALIFPISVSLLLNRFTRSCFAPLESFHTFLLHSSYTASLTLVSSIAFFFSAPISLHTFTFSAQLLFRVSARLHRAFFHHTTGQHIGKLKGFVYKI